MVASAGAEAEDLFERRWRQVKNRGEVSYSPRTGHTVVEHDGVFYLFGGTDKRQRQQDLYKFDTRTGRWERLLATGDIPSRRSGALGVQLDGKMYVFGGYDGRDGNYFNDVHAFDFASRSWTLIRPRSAADHSPHDIMLSPLDPLASRPAARTDHCLAAYRGSLIVFGGYDGQTRYNDTWAFDIADRRWRELTRQQGALKPSQRFGHSGVVHGSCLWIFGGWDGRDTLECVWSLNLETEVWSPLEKLRAERLRAELPLSKHASAPLELLKSASTPARVTRSKARWSPPRQATGAKRVRSAFESSDPGAENAPHIANELRSHTRFPVMPKTLASEVADESADVAAKPHTPCNRYRHSAVLQGDTMVIFGGVDKDHTRFSDLHRFYFDTLTWEPIEVEGLSPTSRTFHRAVCIDETMYILGGYDGADRLNDMFSVHLGGLSPPPLAELAARFVRRNVRRLDAMCQFEHISPFVLDSVVWTRDHRGELRGGRTENGVLICQRLEMERESAADVDGDEEMLLADRGACIKCSVCGGFVDQHELVHVDELLCDDSWQPDLELSSAVDQDAMGGLLQAKGERIGGLFDASELLGEGAEKSGCLQGAKPRHFLRQLKNIRGFPPASVHHHYPDGALADQFQQLQHPHP